MKQGMKKKTPETASALLFTFLANKIHEFRTGYDEKVIVLW